MRQLCTRLATMTHRHRRRHQCTIHIKRGTARKRECVDLIAIECVFSVFIWALICGRCDTTVDHWTACLCVCAIEKCSVNFVAIDVVIVHSIPHTYARSLISTHAIDHSHSMHKNVTGMNKDAVRCGLWMNRELVNRRSCTQCQMKMKHSLILMSFFIQIVYHAVGWACCLLSRAFTRPSSAEK